MFSFDRKTTELKTIEIQRNVNEQKAMEARSREIYRMCRKADRMSLVRQQQLKALDEETRTNALKAKEARERKIEALEREQNLARAMSDLKRREIVEMKNKQLLQNNCHELRHVEKQLRTAYAQKELLCQIREKEALRKEEKARKHHDDLKIIEYGKNDMETETERQARVNELKSEYKMAIEEQIQQVKERRRREKLTLQNGCLMAFEPDENRRKPKHDSNARGCEKETEGLENVRNELRNREREEADKTDKRIQEYLTDVEKRTKRQEEIRNKKKEEKDRLYKCLVDNLTSLKTDTLEKDEMRIVLVQEQQRTAALLAERKEAELKKSRHDEIVKQNDMQLKLKEDCRRDEREKELAQVDKLLRNFRELNAVTEKEARERRQTMIAYREELKRTIELKNDVRNRQRTRMMNESANAANLERLRLAEIEKEKKILVKPHAETLKGFFPLPRNYNCSGND